ncbi:MAG TPA: glycosyl hydrolase family 18 protein [Thermomicrobiales bacterium]|nr:glycosyl hydrolase family 18 protein [Thermomicrobiales bacterium]
MMQRRAAIPIVAGLVLLSVFSALAIRNGDNVADASAVLRWGYYVNYDEASRASLDANLSHLDVVSPYWYHITPSGETKSFAQPTVTAMLQANGVKVLPLVQTEPQWDEFHKTFETPEKRDAIVARLVTVVESNGYDGIQIDFEGINASDDDILTDFMKRLHAAFQPRGWIVSQAVIARTSDAANYWGGAYDYSELAKYNDYIAIMAYDYGYAGRPDPIAVAPIWWVDDVAKYAVSQIPREKIILGVPFYGYDWNTTKGPPATSVSYDSAMKLAERKDADLTYDKTNAANRLRYKDDAGDNHEVWFENADSFDAKLKIVTDYRLAGFAGWRLGHEDPATWTVIASLQTPATRIPPFEQTSDRIYFPETGHSLAYGFLDYWLANGGLARFGYPRTEEFTETDPMVGISYTVQYFERARFEYHPEFAGTEFAVLIGHTGRWALAQRGMDPWETATGPKSGARYFEETGHNLGGAFQRYWEANGGLMTFGYPITEEFTEVNPEDGQSYVVQYFERARFEYHPEYAGTDSEVLLGLLGNEMLRERGWIR